MGKPKRGRIKLREETLRIGLLLKITAVAVTVFVGVYFLYTIEYSPFALLYSFLFLYFLTKILKSEKIENNFDKTLNVMIFTFLLTLLLYLLHRLAITRLAGTGNEVLVDYSFPYAFGVLVLSYIFPPLPSVILTILISLGILGITGSVFVSLYALLLGFGAIYGVLHYGKMRRGTIYRTAFVILYPTSFLFLLLYKIAEISPREILNYLASSTINVLELSIIASFLIPIIEYLFSVISPLRLIELANTNQDIFKKMALEAPGTFHHSLMVATLAERAADAIGANSLLAKTGALYHDIGKLKMPQYYIENQVNLPNPHENKTPTLSAIIIINHVKEGVEMGREMGLPQEIIDFIAQHHGTTLVRYFYAKAKEMGGEVDETTFRYPGPKPQTKETAVVMLCDSAEAAVKSLKEPNEETIRSTVNSIFRSLLDDGQFDEAPITMRELRIVKSEIIKSLTAIHHKRVEYPREGKNGSKPPEENKNKQKTPS